MLNMEYTLKLYTQIYFEQCAEIQKYLWKEDFEERKRRFDWTYHKNPNYHKCLSIIAVSTNDEVLGFRGIFLNKFIIGDKSEIVAQICDTVIIPSARKQGIFSKMNLFSIEILRKEGIKLILDTGPSWTPYYGNKKIGFTDLVPLHNMYNISILRLFKDRFFRDESRSFTFNNIEVVKNNIKYKISDTLSDKEILSVCALDKSDTIHSSLDFNNFRWRISRTNKLYRFVQSFNTDGSLLSFMMLSTTDMKDYNLGLILFVDKRCLKQSFKLFKKYCTPTQVLAWKPISSERDVKILYQMGFYALPFLSRIKKNPPSLILSLQHNETNDINWIVNEVNVLDIFNWNLRKLDLDSF